MNINRITLSLLFIGLTLGKSDRTQVGPKWVSFLSYYGSFSTNTNQDILGNNFQNHTINKLRIGSLVLNQTDSKLSFDVFDYYNVHTPGLAFVLNGIEDTLDVSEKYFSILSMGNWIPVYGRGENGLIKADAKVHWLAFQNFNKASVAGSEGIIIKEDKYGYSPGIEVSLSFDTYLSGVELSYLRTFPINREHIKQIDGVFLNFYFGLSAPMPLPPKQGTTSKRNIFFGFRKIEGEFYEGSWDLKDGKDSWYWGLFTEEGEFDKDGNLTYGKRIYKMKKGYEYTGEFKKDKMHGLGKIKANTGWSFEGEFKSGKINGNGVFTTNNGTHLTGVFTQNTIVDAKGTHVDGKYKYTGTIKNDEPIGNVTVVHESGAVWEGEMKNGQLHNGRGTFISSGSELIGEIKNGQPSGCMIIKDKRQSYLGEMRLRKKRFEFHGMGIMVTERGEIMAGLYKKGVIDKKDNAEDVLENLKEKYPDFDYSSFDLKL